jgi:peptidyl-prolyl cis-trans isomerase-like 2
MVKRQKEKQYESACEHKVNSQLRSGGSRLFNNPVRRLPFHCCALTLAPYENPVCFSNGVVFENTALLPFLMTHRKDPVTGEPRSSKDVINLNMQKDDEGKWQCPILTKAFHDHTKIVAIRHGNEANVYSWQAYQELNLKVKNMEDLVSGEKFTKDDVIILNDPENEAFNKTRDINNFHHILHARSLGESKIEANIKQSTTSARVMEKLTAAKRSSSSLENVNKDSGEKPIITCDMVSGNKFTSGSASSSLTSSSMRISSGNDYREATQEEILQAQFAVMRKLKQKGFVTICTNLGDIGLELHCDIVPRTCTNFLGLAEAGKYNGTKFHRLIPTFMIQGGKATSDESLWDGSFSDEFDDRLKHDKEGIISMANSGPNTNKCQFFLTFEATPHLDRKHTVFGRVIKGTDVLHQMKKVPTDKKNKPFHDIIINGITVLVNPAKEAEELERKRIQNLISERTKEAKRRISTEVAMQVTLSAPSATRSSEESSLPAIGKYLSKQTRHHFTSNIEGDLDVKLSRLPPPPKKTKFGDFNGW